MDKVLKRVFRLAKKTGDVVIVVDEVTQEPYVVMGLDKYEMLRKPAESSHKPDTTTQAELDQEVEVWKMAASEVVSPKVEPIAVQESEVEEGIKAEIVEETNKSAESEPEDAGKKYYFEEVE
jgi:hypothetical protein